MIPPCCSHCAHQAIKLAGGAACPVVLFVGSQILELMSESVLELCLQYKPVSNAPGGMTASTGDDIPAGEATTTTARERQ